MYLINFLKLIKRCKNSKNKALNLERGIYNWSIKEATKKKVVKKWTNETFVQIYIDHFRTIYLNLNKKSYVKNKELLKKT